MITSDSFNIQDYLLNDKLRSFTSIGGYPVFYVTRVNECLCPDCATEDKDSIVASDCNWENPLLFCDECSDRIESAYAEDQTVMDALRD